jgi:flagellar biosynthesis protein FlhG
MTVVPTTASAPDDPHADPRTWEATGRTHVGPAAAGRVIAVASGKGGVGKTVFAITLAHGLARTGRRVLLFDGDLGLANVDIQLGLLPVADLSAIITGRVTLIDARMHHPDGDFDIVAGRSGAGTLANISPAALELLLEALREATASYDFVVFDLGAGLERAVRCMAAFADTLLVLVTDEPTSLTDAYAVLKLHAADAPGADARVVVNLAADHAAGRRTFATLQRACRTFLGCTPALAGVVRRDEHVREVIRRQALLLTRYPTSAAAHDIEATARVVLTVS